LDGGALGNAGKDRGCGFATAEMSSVDTPLRGTAKASVGGYGMGAFPSPLAGKVDAPKGAAG